MIVRHPHPSSSCDGKKRYSQRKARRAARILKDVQGQEVHAYPCQFAAHWHVGHIPFITAKEQT